MEVSVKLPKAQGCGSDAAMNLALEHFRHLLRARDVLSEAEVHTLMVWIATQRGIGRSIVVVEATLIELLSVMDSDMAKDLTFLINSEARNMLMHQMDLMGVPEQEDRDIFRLMAKQKAEAAKRAAKQTDATGLPPLPLAVPNGDSCWYYSNGLECPNKFKDSSGKCKYDHLHKFCGMPLAGGGFCKQDHRAADHK